MRIEWKKTIGISSRHDSQLRVIKDALDFVTETVTYKFCLSYALTYDLPENSGHQDQRGTKWASGNFDENEEVSLLLRALYPENIDHQTLMMAKAEAGIGKIHDMIEKLEITSLSGLFDATA